MSIPSQSNYQEILNAKLNAINNLLAKGYGNKAILKKNQKAVIKDIKKLTGDIEEEVNLSNNNGEEENEH